MGRLLAVGALLTLGCSDNPDDLGRAYTDLLCWRSTLSYTNTDPDCWRVVAISPAGAAIAPDTADACRISETARECRIVQPGETFAVWYKATDMAAPDFNFEGVACDASCPP